MCVVVRFCCFASRGAAVQTCTHYDNLNQTLELELVTRVETGNIAGTQPGAHLRRALARALLASGDMRVMERYVRSCSVTTWGIVCSEYK